MSEKLKNGEQEVRQESESSFVDAEFPEFQGQNDPINQESVEPLPTIESAKKQVQEALKSKEESIDKKDPWAEKYAEKRKLEENVPTDVEEISAWMQKINRLGTNMYDWSSHIELSDKHGGNMPTEIRQKSYDMIEHDFTKSTTGADLILSQARRNLIEIEKSEQQNQDEKEASAAIEESMMKKYERRAVEGQEELSKAELETLLQGLTSAILDREESEDFTSKYQDAEYKILKRQEREVSNALKYGDKCYLGKQLKLLYSQAKQEKNKVSGFRNTRKLKKEESLSLPTDFDDVLKDPARFTPEKLRELSIEYVRMQ